MIDRIRMSNYIKTYQIRYNYNYNNDEGKKNTFVHNHNEKNLYIS